MDSRFLDWAVNEVTRRTTGEKQLWGAVIVRALRDLTVADEQGRLNAADWLLSEEEDALGDFKYLTFLLDIGKSAVDEIVAFAARIRTEILTKPTNPITAAFSGY